MHLYQHCILVLFPVLVKNQFTNKNEKLSGIVHGYLERTNDEMFTPTRATPSASSGRVMLEGKHNRGSIHRKLLYAKEVTPKTFYMPELSDLQITADATEMPAKNDEIQTYATFSANKANAVLNSSGGITSLSSEIIRDGYLEVSRMIWQILKESIPGCHFVIITPDSQKTFILQIIRLSTTKQQPLVVVDTSNLKNEHSQNLLVSLWGVPATNCRTLLIDLTSGYNDFIFKILETSKLWLWPETWVLIVGHRSDTETALREKTFYNTLRPLYLSLSAPLLESLQPRKISINQKKTDDWTTKKSINKSNGTSHLYGRCRYCDNGEAGIRLLFSWWPLGATLPQPFDPFPNQFLDMQGHRIRFVGMPNFPYNEYLLDKSGSQPKVMMLDCIDKRILEAFSAKINFTFVFNAPEDNQWGIYIGNGSWSGLVGTIQFGKADATTMISPTFGRLTIFHHMRAYKADPFAVVSLKPQMLSQYYLILAPFNADVWMYLLLSIVVWGVTFWLLQKASSHVTGYRTMSLTSAILYSLSIIMNAPPERTPSNTSGQMLLGWWLIACIVITSAYNSSLISHLTVQTRAKPIDSWDDLSKQTNWKWGLEESMFKAVPYIYFKESTDPNVMYLFQHLESISTENAMMRILEGRYTLIIQNSLIGMLISSYYTDDFGRTPYYVGKKGQLTSSDFGWGIRKGAPYRSVLQYLLNRILDSGITDYWFNLIKSSRVTQNRKKARTEQQIWRNEAVLQQQQKLERQGQTVLSLNHMMGVFFILCIGYCISFLTFLCEKLAYKVIDK